MSVLSVLTCSLCATTVLKVAQRHLWRSGAATGVKTAKSAFL